MSRSLEFEAGCRTTAMGILPHADRQRALELALSVDIPFWPQLPNVSFYEDMYTQTSQNFPGIVVEPGERKLSFVHSRFEAELPAYSLRMDQAATFGISPEYSLMYHAFLEQDLARYPAIRGQVTGPVSFGFRVADETQTPIIYNEGVRGLLFDFTQRKANAQLHELRARNPHAFVWLDEPGLGWVFSGLSGYNDMQAKRDYQEFLAGLNGPTALHLCANVNLPYLLSLDLQLLSFDAYQIEIMPRAYASAVGDFLGQGGVISWGIVPTEPLSLGRETPETLAGRLTGYWDIIAGGTGLPLDQIARQALLAPARCCVKNAGLAGAREDRTSSAARNPNGSAETQVVEKALAYLRALSDMLKARFRFKD